jgi:ribonucleoside-diphosphate reductase alpha chain
VTGGTATEPLLPVPVARHIWETKYRAVTADGRRDRDIRDTWQRVASALAEPEGPQRAEWTERFGALLDDFTFLPAGRILAGAGTGQRVTLFNCFVMGLLEDSVAGIFDALKEGALTMQAGGGVGYDFSTLRPAGCHARASARIASGPVSFMAIWDTMCATLYATGERRGAMIASLRCDHPDIAAFIDAKRRPGALRHFNLSVQISDAFMDAVAADDDWPLLFPDQALPADPAAGTVMRQWPGEAAPIPCRILRRVSARALWQRLLRASYETGEPGVLFVDRINHENNLGFRERITTTNPCGEVPLPPYGACNLGSVNLSRFVSRPFTQAAQIDLPRMARVTQEAVRLLDNAIDCSWFPLPEQARQARGSRRIGLGVTGLADALLMLGLHYDSPAAREQAAAVMRTICHSAYRASVELAREKSPFPWLARDAYLEAPFIRQLPSDIRRGIARHGIRNSHLTAIAPTGTISLLAGNVSSGIEPIFAARVERRILGAEGDYRVFELEDYACRLWRLMGDGAHDRDLPPAFTQAHVLSPDAHLKMQAALQAFVDNAISKTINVPQDMPYADFEALYQRAYDSGLKGCTTFRPNPVTGQILSALDPAAEPSVHCCNV